MSKLLITLIALVSGAHAALGWGVEPGRSTFKFLKVPVSAREAALAGSGLALPDANAGMADNALAIAEATSPSIQLGRIWLPAEIGAKSADLAMVIPLVDEAGRYGLGITGRYLGWDPIEGRDEDGFATGGYGSDAWTAALGIGRKSGHFSTVVQARFVQQSISRWLSRGVLGDLALFYELPLVGGELSFAAAGKNWGWVSGYTDDEVEFAPSVLQAGLAYGRQFREDLSGAMLLDLRRRSDEKAQPILGTEWSYSLLVFRAGLPVAGNGGSDLSEGMGLRLSEFGVDYGYAGNKNLGGNHHFSLSMSF